MGFHRSNSSLQTDSISTHKTKSHRNGNHQKLESRLSARCTKVIQNGNGCNRSQRSGIVNRSHSVCKIRLVKSINKQIDALLRLTEQCKIKTFYVCIQNSFVCLTPTGFLISSDTFEQQVGLLEQKRIFLNNERCQNQNDLLCIFDERRLKDQFQLQRRKYQEMAPIAVSWWEERKAGDFSTLGFVCVYMPVVLLSRNISYVLVEGSIGSGVRRCDLNTIPFGAVHALRFCIPESNSFGQLPCEARGRLPHRRANSEMSVQPQNASRPKNFRVASRKRLVWICPNECKFRAMRCGRVGYSR